MDNPFDWTMYAVDDRGMDPTGEEPIDRALDEVYGDGTLVVLPAGKYLSTIPYRVCVQRSRVRIAIESYSTVVRSLVSNRSRSASAAIPMPSRTTRDH